MRYPLLILLCCCGPSLFAQWRLSGLVRDEGGEPLPFADVRLLREADSSFVAGLATDEKGYYQLAAPAGAYWLRVDFLGYRSVWSKVVLAGERRLAPLSLVPAGADLAQVTVTGRRPVLEQRADALWFTVAGSVLEAGYDGLEVLERSPNVWLTDEGGILIRNEPVLVLVNDRPLRLEGDALVAYLRSLRSEDILRIEIRTAGGAETAAGTGGGTVNIVLRQPPRGLQGTMTTYGAYGGPGSRSAGGGPALNYGSARWNLYGSYDFWDNRRYVREYTATNYFVSHNRLRSTQLARDSFYRHQWRYGGTVELGPRHLLGGEIAGNASDFVFGQDNDLLLTNGGEVREAGNTTSRGHRNYRSNNLTLNYTWKIDTGGTSLRVFGDYATDNSDRNNAIESHYRLGTIQANQDRNLSDNRTAIGDLQVDLTATVWGGIGAAAGLKWTSTERRNQFLAESRTTGAWTRNDLSSSFRYAEKVGAAYLTASKQLSGRFFLKAGLRAERTRLDKADFLQGTNLRQRYLNLFPSLFLSRELSARTTLTLSYAKRLRRPAFTLLHNNVRKHNDFRYELGNPDLEPEYRHQYEIAVRRGPHQLALYYLNTANAINGIYYLEGEVAYYRKFNDGRQTQHGLEYHFTGDIRPWYHLRASARLFVRKFIGSDGTPGFRQPTAKLRATSVFTLGPVTRLEVRLTRYSPQADAFFIREPLREVDAMIQRQLWKKRLTLRCHVRDILGTLRFANRRPFATFVTTTDYRPFTRTVNLRLTYRFATQATVSGRRTESRNTARGRL